jgi:hypothetical protein
MCDYCDDSGLSPENTPCAHCKEGAKESIKRLFAEGKKLRSRIKRESGDMKKKYRIVLEENTQAIERIRRKWYV